MITKELVAQWWSESISKSDGIYPYDYIAQRAAAHGAAQRDAELMGVGMEPVGYFERNSFGIWWNVSPANADVQGVKPLYTATQLAAARLQGAEDERKRQADHIEGMKDKSRNHLFRSALTIAAADVRENEAGKGERVNQQLLGALKNLDENPELTSAWLKASGAIAAAEKGEPRCPLCSYQHGHAIGCKNNPVDIALYAARSTIAAEKGEQASKRVPLTDEQIDEIFAASAGYGRTNFYALTKAIEAAHGIKEQE